MEILLYHFICKNKNLMSSNIGKYNTYVVV